MLGAILCRLVYVKTLCQCLSADLCTPSYEEKGMYACSSKANRPAKKVNMEADVVHIFLVDMKSNY